MSCTVAWSWPEMMAMTSMTAGRRRGRRLGGGGRAAWATPAVVSRGEEGGQVLLAAVVDDQDERPAGADAGGLGFKVIGTSGGHQ
jgi:hypothetical protein